MALQFDPPKVFAIYIIKRLPKWTKNIYWQHKEIKIGDIVEVGPRDPNMGYRGYIVRKHDKFPLPILECPSSLKFLRYEVRYPDQNTLKLTTHKVEE